MNEEPKNIFSEVRNLFFKYGIKSVTMDDISRELGISKKTLYTHVKDKNELVTQVIELEMTNNECQMDGFSDDSLNAIEELLEMNKQINENIKHLNPVFKYDLRKYYPELYRRFQEANHNKLFQAIVRNIQKGKEEGYFRQELNEDIIARLHVMRMVFFSDSEMVNKDDIMNPDFFNEIFSYHIHGIANEKGIRLYEEKIKQKQQ